MYAVDWFVIAARVLGAVFLGVLVPWVVMRLAIRSFADSPGAQSTNYRGRTVSYGLGAVWLVWAVCAGAASLVVVGDFYTPVSLGGLAVLVAVSFGLGLLDDSYGTNAAKGFRGHIGALRRGVLTTGGMKLFGVAGASLVYAFAHMAGSPWVATEPSALPPGLSFSISVAVAVLAAAAIALTGNVINLTDLRPGRASKAYLILLAVGFIAALLRIPGALGDALHHPATYYVGAVTDLIWLVGPVLAVIGLDLRERGMLGDAGANPMGVLAGAYIVGSLGPIGVVVYLAVVLALNVVSEKVSFTRVIESNAALSRVDNLGRLTDGISDPRE